MKFTTAVLATIAAATVVADKPSAAHDGSSGNVEVKGNGDISAHGFNRSVEVQDGNVHVDNNKGEDADESDSDSDNDSDDNDDDEDSDSDDDDDDDDDESEDEDEDEDEEDEDDKKDKSK